MKYRISGNNICISDTISGINYHTGFITSDSKLAELRLNSLIIGTNRNLKNRPSFYASKMTPTDEFWMRRRFLESRNRRNGFQNFSLDKLPLKLIFFRKFFFHRVERSKLHLYCFFLRL